jgi:DNA invertase Pin-like site-specific DNA recombinase
MTSSARLAVVPSSLARRRAVGVIRVSKVGDRQGERFVSPTEQRRSIEAQCVREDLELVAVFEELDISGGAPLSKRHGIRRAIELIEASEAEVILAAYFDRLVRSLAVQHEILSRVETAGGRVATVDAGEIRADTAARWLSSTMLGMVSEYHRRITSEKVRAAKRDAVNRGVPPFPRIVPGYRRGADGRLELVPDEAQAVAEAFALRADGAPLSQIREHLAERGITRSYGGVKSLLTSRVVLGEIHDGKLTNAHAHPPIVERALWTRAQRVKVPRGRHPASERLLARLGVLRCGSCHKVMSTSTMKSNPTHSKRFAFYRCASQGDCPSPVTISATLVEALVIEETRQEHEEKVGTATLDTEVTDAEAEYERRDALLKAAIRAFDGLDVSTARERLLELQRDVEVAEDRLRKLRAAVAPAEVVSVRGRIVADEWRALIQVTWQRIIVKPAPRQGRYGHGHQAGRARLTFEPFEQ